MQTVTQYSANIIQKIITPCAVTAAYNTNLSQEQTTGVRAEALWDTGATRSVITPDVVKKLNLKPADYRIIQTANGNVSTQIYNVNIELDNGLQFNNVNVAAVQLPTTQVIIGMDVIMQGDMAITNGNQKTTFSFQVPATRTIDFKEDEEKVNNALLRREFNVVSNTMTTVNGHNRKMILRKRLLYV